MESPSWGQWGREREASLGVMASAFTHRYPSQETGQRTEEGNLCHLLPGVEVGSRRTFSLVCEEVKG